MADVRALLKAKRQEARINHPYAAYGANGALRCTACGVAVKFASAWEGHLGSKSHRVAVAAKLKKTKEEEEPSALSKRKAEEDEEDEEGVEGDGDGDGDDRRHVGTTEGAERSGKRQRTEEREMEEEASRSFPADFFSDPSRALPRDDEDEDEMDQDQERSAAPKSQFDMEWEAFERDLQQRPAVGGGGAEAAVVVVDDARVVHTRATIAAEPELVSSLVGLPAGAQEEGVGVGVGEQAGRKAVAMSSEEERKRKEMDERELIMDRFVEEERAQEDAYNRVALLRNKVQMLKQKRELAKAKGKKTDTDMQT